MTEFCKFILTLNFIEWLKIMATLLLLTMFVEGIVGTFGAKFGRKEVKVDNDNE